MCEKLVNDPMRIFSSSSISIFLLPNDKFLNFEKLLKSILKKENTFEQYYSNDRVDLNKYFNIKQAELHLPSRTLKKYKAPFEKMLIFANLVNQVKIRIF